MSQEKLGDLVGVTFQQIQKYEKGHNRVGGSRLEAVAKALRVPPGYFFGDSSTYSPEDELAHQVAASLHGVRIMRAFLKLDTPERVIICDLADSLVAKK